MKKRSTTWKWKKIIGLRLISINSREGKTGRISIADSSRKRSTKKKRPMTCCNSIAIINKEVKTTKMKKRMRRRMEVSLMNR